METTTTAPNDFNNMVSERYSEQKSYESVVVSDNQHLIEKVDNINSIFTTMFAFIIIIVVFVFLYNLFGKGY